MIEDYCLADVSSLAYLDLNVREFRRSRLTSPLFLALDFASKGIIRDNVLPNVPMIEIFKSRERTDGLDSDFQELEASFFTNFFRNRLATFVGNWKTENMKTFFKHIREYNGFVKTKIYFVNISESERRYGETFFFQVLLNYFQSELMLSLAPELIKILLGRRDQDSCLVADFFHTFGISYQIEEYLFFRYEPQITEYLVYHLRKAKFNFSDFFDEADRRYWLRKVMEWRPDNLLVLLKYGLENIYSRMDNKELEDSLSDVELHGQPLYWKSCRQVELAVRADAKPLKNRELYILEVILWFLAPYKPYAQVNFRLETQKFIWRSIPDAYLSYEEMKHAPLVFQGTCDKCVEDVIEEFQKRDFEGFVAIPQPRSLMHYSRCTIRRALNCNLQLIHGIEHLGLPKKMQSYLKLEF